MAWISSGFKSEDEWISLLGYVRSESRSEIEEVEASIAIVIELQERFPRPLWVQPRRLLFQHGHKHVARQELSFGPTCKHHPQNDDQSQRCLSHLYPLLMMLTYMHFSKKPFGAFNAPAPAAATATNPNPHENRAEQAINHWCHFRKKSLVDDANRFPPNVFNESTSTISSSSSPSATGSAIRSYKYNLHVTMVINSHESIYEETVE